MNPKSNEIQEKSSESSEDSHSFMPKTKDANLLASEQQLIQGAAATYLKTNEAIFRTVDKDAEKTETEFKNPGSRSSRNEDDSEKSYNSSEYPKASNESSDVPDKSKIDRLKKNHEFEIKSKAPRNQSQVLKNKEKLSTKEKSGKTRRDKSEEKNKWIPSNFPSPSVYELTQENNKKLPDDWNVEKRTEKGIEISSRKAKYNEIQIYSGEKNLNEGFGSGYHRREINYREGDQNSRIEQHERATLERLESFGTGDKERSRFGERHELVIESGSKFKNTLKNVEVPDTFQTIAGQKEVLQHVMQGKHSEKMKETPGPGYSDKEEIIKEKYYKNKIGIAKGEDLDINDKPSSAKFGIGTGSRSRDEDYSKGDQGSRKNSFQESKGHITGKADKQLISNISETPGPGSYNLELKKEGPHYSMQGRYPEKIEETPGPGSYEQDIDIRQRSHSNKFGSSGREFSQPNYSPGPGTYEAIGTESGAKWKFVSESKTKVNFEEIPGPGAYEYVESKASIGYTMAGKGKDMIKDNTPGPGAYEPLDDVAKLSSPNYRMGTASKEKHSINEGPGPGAYSSQDIKFHSMAPAFGNAERTGFFEASETPGPGSYNIESLREGPHYTMQGRYKEYGKSQTPSAGYYSQEINDVNSKERAPTFRFGSAERDLVRINENPGPGYYDIRERQDGPKWVIGSELRTREIETEIPGPGTYQYTETKSSVAYTMAGRAKDMHKDNFPGPGSYQPRDDGAKSSSPKYVIGKASRESQFVSEVPGPGTYSSQDVRPHSNAPVIGTGSRSTLNDVRDIPGPGTYQIEIQREGPQYTMQGRYSDNKKETSPGPGYYNQETNDYIVKTRAPNYKIGSAAKGIIDKNDLPGPGTYDIIEKEGGMKWGFGSEPRSKEFENEVPGPGTYQLIEAKSPVAYTIAGRGKEIAKDNFPGPGTYSIDDDGIKQSSPKYGMGTSSRDKKNVGEVPGPGTYSPNEVKMYSKAPVIGTSVRPPLNEIKDIPGPGNYNLELQKEGPHYSMQGKSYEKNFEQSPGPGYYNQDIVNKEKAPAYKIGTAEKITTDINENPGPGAYEYIGKEGGPKWVFGSESKHKEYTTEVPGPGTYQYSKIKSSVAFSMAGKGKDYEKDNFPGPGFYSSGDDGTKLSSPKYSMGKSERDQKFVSDVPGPGTYSSQEIRPHSVAPVIGLADRPPLSETTENPGPGYYNLELQREGPHYTMQGKYLKNIKEKSPGPGHYYQETNDVITKERAPSFKIGTAERGFADKNDNPGPGTYETTGKEERAKWGFGSELRTKEYATEVPGPGSYQHYETKSSIAFTMAGRAKDLEKDNFPGPGFYGSGDDGTKLSSPKYSMGKSERDQQFASDVPGPGTYSSQEVRPHSVAPVLGTASRPPLSETTDNPGPGCYNLELQKEGPHYSMQGKYSEHRKEISPGPGHYNQETNDVNTKERAPRFKIGTAERGFTDKNDNPGPGTYETTGKEEGAKWGFGSELRTKEYATEVPGPGAYQHYETKSSFGFTMAGKGKDFEKDNFPGPGFYGSGDDGTKLSSPKYSMGKSERDKQFVSDVPGPGTYSSQEIRPHSVAPVIGTASRPPLSETTENPGPGYYNSELQREGPHYTMQGKYSENKKENSPGPGYYNQETNDVNTKERAPTFKIGTAERGFVDKNDNPGPGTYESTGKEEGPKWGFGSELRNKEYATEVPGPGTYQYPETKSSVAFTMAGRGKDLKKDNFPGPGFYDPGNGGAKLSSPKYSMGKSERDQLFASSVPGPGTYSSQDVRPHSVAPVIGTASRPPLTVTTDNPGPGYYNLENQREGPHYSMQGKYSGHRKENSPGPGHYNQETNDFNTKERAPTLKIGTAERGFADKNDNPGPGTYETTGKEEGPKWGFGSESKTKEYATEGPGPGAYQHYETKSSVGYTMAGRGKDLEKDNFPGPGFYGSGDDGTKLSSPKYSMGKSERDHQLVKDVPGPGTYSSQEVRPHSVAPIIGSASRPPLSETTDNPGPGCYNLELQKEGPHYSMQGKYSEHRKEISPGPGHYNQETNDVNKKERAPTFKIGTAERGFADKNDNPGPGTYETTGKEEGAKWRFGSELRTKEYATEVPGPGAYQHYETKSSIAFTMAGKGKDFEKDNFPGPGFYGSGDDRTKLNSPKYSMGKSKRDQQFASDVPGPGTYSSQEVRPHSIAPVIGTASRPPLSETTENPGPGYYNSELQREGPHYTMQGKYFENRKENSPGPGHYNQETNDVNTKERAPTFKIGTAERGFADKNDNPGPGTYETVVKEEGPKWGFGSELRTKEFATEVPGPGAYQHYETKSSVAFTMTGKGKDFEKDNFPGPGFYDPGNDGTQLSSPKYSMGKSRRDHHFVSDVPGPGTYSSNEIRPHSIAPVIGSAVRPPLSETTKNPGPGCYNLELQREGPHYSMQGKYPEQRKENSPGPGDYNLETNDFNTKERAPAFKIGTAERGLADKNDNPGPGTYETTGKEEGPKWGFGSESRNKEITTEVPGPGAYQHYETKSSIAFTMAGRAKDLEKDNFPGPGFYGSGNDGTKLNSPKYSMGKSERDQKFVSDVPGPGTYSSQEVRPHSVAPVLGTASRPPLSETTDNPGPGCYSLELQREGPHYSMQGKYSGHRKENSPGPGHYNQETNDVNTKERAPTFKIGTAERGFADKNDNPGPGTYETTGKEEGPKWGFGSELRTKEYATEVPGPGAYQHYETKSSVAFTMAGRAKDFEKDNFPGPGFYDPGNDGTNLSSPKYSMGKSERDKQFVSDVPGPGTYSSQEVRPHSIAPVIGIASRPPLSETTDNPGPGSYNLELQQEGPHYTMQGKYIENKKENSPGPGHYNQDTNDVNTKERAPTFKIGTAERGFADKNDNPGPGTYETIGKEGGPKWGFGSESKIKENVNEVPGPGSYQFTELKPSIGYTMAGKLEDLTKYNFPGPGTYNPEDHVTKLSSPKYGMGSTPREKKFINDVPGPGTYSFNEVRPHSVAPVIGTSTRPPLSEVPENPGPGSYNLELNNDGPHYTMQGKNLDKIKERSPSPGHYYQDTNEILTKERSPTIKFGTAERGINEKNENPGPGAYLPAIKQEGPKWGFGSESREKELIIEVPGPGTYQIPDTKSKTAYSMARKGKELKKDNFPGPGTYQAKEDGTKLSPPKYSMGTASKDKKFVNEIPGPGAYSSSDVRPHSSAPVIGSSNRSPLRNVPDNPGPGAYNLVPQASGPLYTMQGKPPSLKIEEIPGPGTYSQATSDNLIIPKSPAYKIGTEPRGQKLISENPGPGAYDIVSRKPPGPNWVIGSKQKSKKPSTAVPGPGSYQIPSEKSGGYTMRGRSRETNREIFPGPGTYDPKEDGTKLVSPSYRMGQSSREKKFGNFGPGPGTYSTNMIRSKSSAAVIGVSVRPDIVENSDTPGPGAYNIQVKPTGAGFTMQGRYKDRLNSKSPGPGHYHQEFNSDKIKEKSPNYRIGTAERKVINKNENPGPGTYQVTNKDLGPKWRFGSEGRNKLPASDIPGPGSYNIPGTKSSTGFTMAGRPKIQSKEQFPGPGTYRPGVDGAKISPPKFKMSKSSRELKLKNEVPGPGTYDANYVKTKSIAPVIGTSSRPPLSESPENPGPGSYNLELQKEGPQYSMQGRYKENIKDQNPGPGQYNPENIHLNTKERAPAYKIGSAKRENIDKNENPGPGVYSIASKEAGPQWGFGSELKSKEIVNKIPGPGTYITGDTKSKIAFSMARKGKDLEKDNFPGPGSYEPVVDGIKLNSPRYGMGTESKDKKFDNEIPGPGTYQTNLINSHSSAPVIGTATRPPLSEVTENPGPGAYKIEVKNDGPQYTIRGRPPEIKREISPGPGQYNHEDINTKEGAPTYRIGSAERGITEKNDNPGPGAYNYSSKESGPKWVFGSESKTKEVITDIPGPGTYQFADTKSKTAYSMAGKGKDLSKDNFPGPGSYKPEDNAIRPSSPKYGMGTSPRDRGIVNEIPGPGNYSTQDIRPHSNAPIMGTANRPPLSEITENPGPGTYNLELKKDGPQFSMQGKYEDKLKEYSPGPGEYDQGIVQADKGPSYKIGTATRENIDKNNNPGPGAYNTTEKESGPKWGFGSEPKKKDVKEDLPGPGAYELADTKSKIAFSITGKGKDLEKDNLPGPGTYNPKDDVIRPSSPKYVIASSQRDKIIENDIPGPGTYSPQIIRPHFTAPVTGTGKRPPLSETTENPGPGSYNIEVKKDGPQYTIQGRYDEKKREKSPGPGEYEIEYHEKDKGFSYKIGTAERVVLNKNDNPGPGSYNITEKEFGIEWGFGSEPREKTLKNEVPGPGTYDIVDKKSKTAYSMAGKGKDLDKDNFPGPGTYDPEDDGTKLSSPKYGMGTASKEKKIVNDVPGPGTYTSQDIRPHSLAPVIGTANRPPLSETLENPGPGEYNIELHSDGPKYTFTGRHPEVIKNTNPGPSSYFQEKDNINAGEKAPAYSIGTAERGIIEKNDNPGPGTYNMGGIEAGPKWKFGSEARTKEIITEVPGPGTYQVTDTNPKIAYSMAGKGKDLIKDQFPGPGTYEPGDDGTKLNSPKYGIGTESRDKKNENNIPGPGSYTSQDIRPHSTAPLIGNSKRPPLSATLEGPGPGSYNLELKSDGPQYTMQGKHKVNEIDQIPGPGEYDQNLMQYEKGPAYTMGTSDRGKFEVNNNPGPGTYDHINKESGPVWGFGSETRTKDNITEVPGPGTYNINDTKSKIAYSMLGKGKDLTKDNMPGPGSYQPVDDAIRSSSPKYVIGKSPRDKNISNEIPGPGTYTTKDVRPHSVAPVIGTANRPNLNEILDTPGPGAYNLKLPKEGPEYTMKGKYKEKNRIESPGPGEYDQDFISKEKGPAYKIGTSERGTFDINSNPGPGSYNLSGKEEGPKWVFGSEVRTKDFTTEIPGPGSYQIPDTKSKTAYSMTGRNKELGKDNFPGPGNYNVEDDLIRPSSPKYVFGTSPRDNIISGDIPGPGTYSTQEIRPHSKAPIIGTAEFSPLIANLENPGPGTYEVSTKNEGPKWKFGSESKTKEIISEVPGPGMYEIEGTLLGAGYTMTGRAKDTERENFPGPGTYDAVESDQGIFWKFGSESRNKNFRSLTPGPGSYNIQESVDKNSGFTISGRGKIQKIENFPGPGTYDAGDDGTKISSPKYKMGTTPRDNKIVNDVPGPGSYSSQEIRPHSNAPIIGISQRQGLSKILENPGPGTYNLDTIREGPYYSIQGRYSERIGEKSPGPGYYNQDTNKIINKENAPAFKIGTAERGIVDINNNPGPGAYETMSKESGPKWVFGSEPKTKEFTTEVPGPGAYEFFETKSSVAFTMAGKGKDFEKDNFPGPGVYDPGNDGTQLSSPKYSMGKSERDKHIVSGAPGPGTYSTQEVRPHSFAPVIGTASRPPLSETTENPGPGYYNLELQKEGPHYSMQGKYSEHKKDNSPGPGHYNQETNDVNTKERAPTFKIGTAERGFADKNDNPGPGTYETTGKEEGPKWGFGSELRTKEYATEVPGPGAYQHYETKSSIAFTMAGRAKDFEKDNFPGPGVYDPGNDGAKLNSPKYSMGKSERDKHFLSDVPGPGTYSSQEVRPHSFAPVIGTASRPSLSETTENPGPGYYNSELQREGPHYSMQGKYSENKKDNSPGPGHYNQDTNDVIIKERAPTFKIGTAERGFADKNDNPGPGTYETKVNEEGPKWGFGSELRTKEYATEVPGPGSYEHFETKSSVGFTMAGKGKDFEKDNFPGPGVYDPGNDGTQLSSPKYSMGKSERDKHIVSGAPGPGTYSSQEVRPHSFAPVIGTASRPPLSETTENPGPGYYNSELQREGPHYSMQGKYSENKKDNSPGPGHYNQDTNDVIIKERAPTFKIGTAERGFSDKNDNPGPGTYETKGNEEGPKWVFGSELRNKEHATEVPGPGTYEYFETKSSVAFTMAGKLEDLTKDNFPGPGTYNPGDELTKLNSPKYSMGKSERNKQFVSDVPGPGAYSSQEVRSHSVAPVTGTASRPPLSETTENPGPGYYNIELQKEGPHYSMQGKNPENRKEYTPGPGHYNQETNDVNIKERAPTFKIGHAERGIVDKNDNPGPGTYESTSKKEGPKWVFGSESKTKEHATVVPGPGNYEHFETKSSVAFTMARKGKDLEKDKFPGPGFYDPDKDGTQLSSPKYSMGKSGRDHQFVSDVPGPGTYSSNEIRPHSVAPVIGTAPRPPLSETTENPGPGYYNLELQKEGPHYSMQGKYSENRIENNPGPGHYNQETNDVNTKERAPKFKIGTAERGLADKNDNPGPGTYETTGKEEGPKWGFGSERRTKEQTTEVPGPGTYQYSETKSPVAFTMAGKGKDFEKDNFPGPGVYDPGNDGAKLSSPKYSMGKSERDKQFVSDVPGPGTYSSQELRPHSFAPVIGTASRPPLSETTENPGPGYYNPELQREGPHYSMQGKYSENKKDNSPGPGHYNQETNDVIIKERAPTFKIGNAGRGFADKNDNPGPGTYETKGNEEGPKWGFGSELRTKEHATEVPGPGTYEHFETKLSVAFTMAGKLEDLTKDNFPGPGTYNPGDKLTKLSSPKFSMGKNERDKQLVNYVPGPGAYSSQEVRPHSVAPVIGTASRPPLSETIENPGPGYYNLETLREGPHYSIQGKYSENRKGNGPGPGYYNQETNDVNIKERAPTFKIGTAERGFADKNVNPGPGTYETIGKEEGPKWGFGSEPRTKEQTTEVPGPGTYQYSDTKSSVAFTMGGKGKNFEKDNFPGPGFYDPDKDGTQLSSPKYSMGKSERDHQFVSDVPGPGTYSSNEIRPHSVAPVIGTASRPPLSETTDNPGPGYYNSELQREGREGPHYSMQGKYSENRIGNNPGPGHYNQETNDVNTKERAPTFKIGTAERGFADKNDNPGPGTYETIEKEEGPKWGFGSELRIKEHATEVPGPGAYQPYETKSSVAFTMAGKGKDFEKDNFPGPGFYDPGNVGTNLSSPKYSMGISERDHKFVSGVPGPGTYSSQELRPHSVAPVIGTASRPPLSETIDNPGPGYYSIELQREGPHYSMQGKYSENRHEKIPGPGHYNQETNDIITKERAPTYKIGSADRGFIEKNENPAPGDYNIIVKEDGPKWRFGSESRTLEFSNAVPGPGAYNPEVKEKSPSYKIGTELREKTITSEIPGPGSYQTSDNIQGPKWTFGKDSKEKLVKNDEPGPGYYEIIDKEFEGGFTIKGKGKVAKIEEFPGPGDYDIQGKIGGVQWKFGSEIREKEIKNLGPAPGAYDIIDTKPGTGFSIVGKGKEESQMFNYPGPGHYDPNSDIKFKTSPSFSIGKDSKKNQVNTSIPGPGEYYVSEEYTTSNAAVFGSGSRGPINEISDTPGPGKYYLHDQRSGPFYSIQGKHSSDFNPETPGPGTYNPEVKEISPSYKFGTETRITKIVNDTPGPGSYNIQENYSGPKWNSELKVDAAGLGVHEIREETGGVYSSVSKGIENKKVYLSEKNTYNSETETKYRFGSEVKATEVKSTISGQEGYDLNIQGSIKTSPKRRRKSETLNFEVSGSYIMNQDQLKFTSENDKNTEKTGYIEYETNKNNAGPSITKTENYRESYQEVFIKDISSTSNLKYEIQGDFKESHARLTEKSEFETIINNDTQSNPQFKIRKSLRKTDKIEDPSYVPKNDPKSIYASASTPSLSTSKHLRPSEIPIIPPLAPNKLPSTKFIDPKSKPMEKDSQSYRDLQTKNAYSREEVVYKELPEGFIYKNSEFNLETGEKRKSLIENKIEIKTLPENISRLRNDEKNLSIDKKTGLVGTYEIYEEKHKPQINPDFPQNFPDPYHIDEKNSESSSKSSKRSVKINVKKRITNSKPSNLAMYESKSKDILKPLKSPYSKIPDSGFKSSRDFSKSKYLQNSDSERNVKHHKAESINSKRNSLVKNISQGSLKDESGSGQSSSDSNSFSKTANALGNFEKVLLTPSVVQKSGRILAPVGEDIEKIDFKQIPSDKNSSNLEQGRFKLPETKKKETQKIKKSTSQTGLSSGLNKLPEFISQSSGKYKNK